MQPATIPSMGDQSCTVRGERSSRTAMSPNVTMDTAGAAQGDTPSGTLVSILNTPSMTVADMSIRTMPDTVGVIIRRNSERRAATTNFISDEITTRLASIAGPPSISAVMLMCDGRFGGTDDKYVPRADTPDTQGVQNRGSPTDYERREDRPGQVCFRLLGGTDDDDYGYYHQRYQYDGKLDTGNDCGQRWTRLFRLKTDGVICVL